MNFKQTKKIFFIVILIAVIFSGQVKAGESNDFIEKEKDEYEEEISAERKKKTFEELSIRLKALQVANQISAYLKENPHLTLKELQSDEYFKDMAVQAVGKTGYTAVTDYDTLINRFHKSSDIVNLDLHTLADKLPGFYGIMSQTQGGQDAEGIYDWEDADGSIKQKYMYISVVDAKTADGVGLHVAATTYLNEYENFEIIKDDKIQNDQKQIIKGKEDLSRAAQDASKKIEIITNSFSRDIKSLSQTLGIRKLLVQVKDEGVLTNTEIEKKYYPQDKEKYWQNVYEYFLRFYGQNTEEIDLVRLFYKNGYVVSGVILGEEDVNDYKGDKSWFKDVMNPSVVKGGEVYISPISIARRTNSAAIRYAVPIDVDGERLGLAVINFKAGAILKAFSDSGNVLFLDKAYENAEGEVTDDWVVTLADSRNPGQALDEGGEAASVIAASQLIGNSGFLEFEENGEIQIGAYQKVDIPCKEWYAVAIVHSDEFKESQKQAQNINETLSTDYVNYIYWFFWGIIIIFFVLALLYYFKIIEVERITLLAVLAIFFLLISGMFVFGSYSTVKNLKDYFKNNYINQHLRIGNLLAEEIVDLIDGMKIELEYLVKTVVSENFNKENYFNLLKGAYERNKDYIHIAYQIDKDGIIREMYPMDNAVIGGNISEQEQMKKLRKTLRPVLSNIFDAPEGFKGITLYYPIIKNGEYDGVVAFLANIDDFFDIISPLFSNIYPHESFLFDGKGQIIASCQTDYIGKNIIEIEKYKIVKDNCKNILKADKAGFEDFVLEEENQIVVYVPIEIQDNKWTLAVKGREKDAYHDIDSTLNNIWFFALIALISFFIFGLLFSYFLTRSLRTEVEMKTAEIKKSSGLMKEQLKREEETTRAKEQLLKKQKEGKKQLEEKIKELKKFQKLTVNREFKMIELKEKLNKLKNKGFL
ncbi:hypothetical protein KAU09_04900 [Candidatus Parcubacteria bacterium]|nr:hypothetical protein [Candidatus Parcubacteria bacterium]